MVGEVQYLRVENCQDKQSLKLFAHENKKFGKIEHVFPLISSVSPKGVPTVLLKRKSKSSYLCFTNFYLHVNLPDCANAMQAPRQNVLIIECKQARRI